MKKKFVNEGETVVLFDMDGTLTPPRKPISSSVVLELSVLSSQAKIGIVSGSPYSYLRQQLSDLWGPNGISKDNIILMPCNGTQVYSYDESSKDFVREYYTDFKNHFAERFGSKAHGKDAYTCLVKDVLELQLDFLEDYAISDVSGNFLSYRGSLVNWSMIGRDADEDLRNQFRMLDDDLDIRNKLRNSLRVRLDTSGLGAIECVLGGSTSIDIYPEGWDKTHCLQHVEGAEVWFWGDRCELGGNDYTLYKKLGPGVRSFSVNSPKELSASLRKNLDIDWQQADLIAGNLERNFTVGSD